jgi:hypothetical protein
VTNAFAASSTASEKSSFIHDLYNNIRILNLSGMLLSYKVDF